MLLATYLARVNWQRVFTLETRRYAADYLSPAAADRLSWQAFRRATPSLFDAGVVGALEALVVSKSVTWSDRDVNVYVGRAGEKPLRSCLDLTEGEFVAVFAWHVAVARQVSAILGHDVYLTHGFNPEDSSPDAHSVTAKFHTHLHVPDVMRRRPVRAAELSQFDRLALVEPFSAVFWDLMPPMPGWRLTAGFGYLSGESSLDPDLHAVNVALVRLHNAYHQLVDVFTAGHTERVTGHHRCVPRPRAERQQRLTAFEELLSGESSGLLRYLARNLTSAQPRDDLRSTRISNAGQLWVAKGFSGALNFVVSAARSTVRFDFAPRVISTSGATKVISTDPTIIRKDRGPALPAEQRRMHDFHRVVVAAAARLKGGRLPSTSSSQAPPALSA